MREREALQKRINGESDEVTKMRLAAALAALDAQRDQRQELTRAAARFDAEHTRISYTLESLYTQVVRMRSADSSSVDVAGAGLRRSLDMLSQEVNALADALERVNSGDTERMRKVASGPAADSGATPPAAPGKREKA
jgi:seryl-tRNA synthetase